MNRPIGGVGAEATEDGGFRFRFPDGFVTRRLPDRLVDVEGRLAWMDAEGVDIQVLSSWADIFAYGLPAHDATRWCEHVNATLKDVAASHPRFLALASLPMQSPSDAVAMLEDVVAEGFAGVTFAAHIDGVELDDESLEPFWAAASELGVVVLLHPSFGEGDPRTAPYGMTNAVGRGVDTTIAAARLIFSGVLERYPGVEVILSHGGGAIPYLAGRLARNRAIDQSLGDPEQALRQLYFDSVVFDPTTLEFLVKRAGDGSVLLGSDYPFPIGDPHPRRVVEEANLSEMVKQQILGGSAMKLFGVGEEG